MTHPTDKVRSKKRKLVSCPTCSGKKKVRANCYEYIETTCTHCKGSGKVIKLPLEWELTL